MIEIPFLNIFVSSNLMMDDCVNIAHDSLQNHNCIPYLPFFDERKRIVSKYLIIDTNSSFILGNVYDFVEDFLFHGMT